jgi:hypothetical protein
MRGFAVAPIQYRGVAMRHVGPRDAAYSPATDLDLDSLFRAGPVRAGPGSQWKSSHLYPYQYWSVLSLVWPEQREASLGCVERQ